MNSLAAIRRLTPVQVLERSLERFKQDIAHHETLKAEAEKTLAEASDAIARAHSEIAETERAIAVLKASADVAA